MPVPIVRATASWMPPTFQGSREPCREPSAAAGIQSAAGVDRRRPLAWKEMMKTALLPRLAEFSDADLARAIAAGDAAAVRLVTERNNQRLFRAAWSILKNRDDAEDAVQAAYLRAFAAIGSFEGRSSLSTWLTRIAINEALGRVRAERRRRARLDGASVVHLDEYREKLMRGSTSAAAPD